MISLVSNIGNPRYFIPRVRARGSTFSVLFFDFFIRSNSSIVGYISCNDNDNNDDDDDDDDPTTPPPCSFD